MTFPKKFKVICVYPHEEIEVSRTVTMLLASFEAQSYWNTREAHLECVEIRTIRTNQLRRRIN